MTTETLPRLADDPPAPPPRRHRRRWMVIALVLLVVGGVAARVFWPAHAADVRAGTTAVSTDGMAAQYGIEVNLIGVTAAGGLIEFRYQVVDPDKADPIVHDPKMSPALVVEGTGETLVLGSPPHHHSTQLELGGTYFFLIANAHNTLHPGDRVTLVIGDARLEHIGVQG